MQTSEIRLRSYVLCLHFMCAVGFAASWYYLSVLLAKSDKIRQNPKIWRSRKLCKFRVNFARQTRQTLRSLANNEIQILICKSYRKTCRRIWNGSRVGVDISAGLRILQRAVLIFQKSGLRIKSRLLLRNGRSFWWRRRAMQTISHRRCCQRALTWFRCRGISLIW